MLIQADGARPVDSSRAASALLERALKSDVEAVNALIASLTPTIEASVARVLRRGARGRNIDAAVKDLAQDVWLVLFDEQGKVLRTWDARKGLSLPRFVSVIAERRALDVARSKRLSPFAEEPSDGEGMDRQLPAQTDHEQQVASREMCTKIARRLRMELSPYGLQMFELLFIQEKSIEQISQELDMSHEAIYAWRSRLIRQARAIADELMAERTDRSTRSRER